MPGNDGNIWRVAVNSAGVQRWVRTNKSSPNQTMKYKFNIGDVVRITTSGYGVGPEDVHKEVTITGKGEYGNIPGYSFVPKLGNCLSGCLNGVVGESSFVFYTEPFLFELY